MKKILFTIVVAFSTYSFAQTAKSNGVTDCKELKFWIKALQTKLKTVDLTFNTKTGTFESKRKFKGFDITEYSVYEAGQQYHVKGINSAFKNPQSAREHFKKLIALIQDCDSKFSLQNDTYKDNETNGYCVVTKKLSTKTLLQIELIWDANGLEDAYPENYIACAIYYSKEITEE
ncbi:MAG: hypothetical protein KBF36_11075 [Chitinophagaceae bacterium]|nr:hypothetical protein [Chitinophagaceae bacterium]